ncbi:MAG: carboxypeptidase-like regulatory domain-containing protein, partial [Balneolaceae bacterium]
MVRSLTKQMPLAFAMLLACTVGWLPGLGVITDAHAQVYTSIATNISDNSSFFMVRNNSEYIQELRTPVTIQVQNEPIRDVLRIIATKADLGLVFNDELESLDQKISLNLIDTSVGDAFMYALNGTGYEPVISMTREIVLARTVAPTIEEDIQLTIIGQVTDANDGSPIPGANVIVQGSEALTGSTIGTTTDLDGRYELNVPDGLNTLQVSFIGYEVQTIEIAGRTEINVALQQSVQLLDDVVVVGYGTQERRQVTGSISSVNSSEFVTGNVNNAAELIQGKVPGL